MDIVDLVDSEEELDASLSNKRVNEEMMSTSITLSSSLGNRVIRFVSNLDPVDEYDTDYNCGICFNIADEPVRCGLHCNKPFCKNCMNRAFQYNFECPACKNDDPADGEIDTFVKNEIKKHEVYCPNESSQCNGNNNQKKCNQIKADNDDCCEWRGRYGQLETHLKTCSFEKVICLYENQGCDDLIQRRVFDTHLQSCEYRMIKCDHCQKPMTVISIAEHLSICDKVEVGCKLCGISVKRCDLKTHLDHVCDKVEVRCIVPGCKVSFLRELNDKHYVDEISQHAILWTRALDENTDTIAALKREVELRDKALKREVELRDKQLDLKEKENTAQCNLSSRIQLQLKEHVADNSRMIAEILLYKTQIIDLSDCVVKEKNKSLESEKNKAQLESEKNKAQFDARIVESRNEHLANILRSKDSLIRSLSTKSSELCKQNPKTLNWKIQSLKSAIAQTWFKEKTFQSTTFQIFCDDIHHTLFLTATIFKSKLEIYINKVPRQNENFELDAGGTKISINSIRKNHKDNSIVVKEETFIRAKHWNIGYRFGDVSNLINDDVDSIEIVIELKLAVKQIVDTVVECNKVMSLVTDREKICTREALGNTLQN